MRETRAAKHGTTTGSSRWALRVRVQEVQAAVRPHPNPTTKTTRSSSSSRRWESDGHAPISLIAPIVISGTLMAIANATISASITPCSAPCYGSARTANHAPAPVAAAIVDVNSAISSKPRRPPRLKNVVRRIVAATRALTIAPPNSARRRSVPCAR